MLAAFHGPVWRPQPRCGKCFSRIQDRPHPDQTGAMNCRWTAGSSRIQPART